MVGLSRLVAAALLAISTTAGLFSLMAVMVDGGKGGDGDRVEVQPVSVLMTDRLEQTNRRERSLPEPPPPLPQMPTAQTNQTSTAVDIAPPAMPDVGAIEGGGVSVAMPSRGLPQVQDRQAMPLYRVEPIYPQKALSRKLEGYVIMAFTIDETGRPKGISVVEAQPMRVFDRAAIRALSKWKYQPKLVDGKAVTQPNQTVKLEFQLRQ